MKVLIIFFLLTLYKVTISADEIDTFLVKFDVNLSRGKKGSFVIEVHPDWAPLGADRMREIVSENVS